MSYPLEGVRVLELGQIIAGTYGSQVLSDLGAEVIKIEAPEGDLGRISSVAPIGKLSGLFLTCNRNKKSVVINLKNETGRKVFYDLAWGRRFRNRRRGWASIPMRCCSRYSGLASQSLPGCAKAARLNDSSNSFVERLKPQCAADKRRYTPMRNTIYLHE
jgi:hypothetical protein